MRVTQLAQRLERGLRPSGDQEGHLRRTIAASDSGGACERRHDSQLRAGHDVQLRGVRNLAVGTRGHALLLMLNDVDQGVPARLARRQRRAAVRPRLRGLDLRRKRVQRVLGAEPTDELDARRQSVDAVSDGDRDRRLAGEVEDRRPRCEARGDLEGDRGRAA